MGSKSLRPICASATASESITSSGSPQPGTEPHQSKDVASTLTRRTQADPGRKGSHHDVFRRGQTCERTGDLEGLGKAATADLMWLEPEDTLSSEQNFAMVRLHHSGQQVRDGRLAGSVGADHADDIPLGNREADVVDGLDTPKGSA